MPYIRQEDRDRVSGKVAPKNAGELNYLFSLIISEYLSDRGLTYAHMNEVIGALECCKLELYRRVAAPYEDKKIKENGDVYPNFI